MPKTTKDGTKKTVKKEQIDSKKTTVKTETTNKNTVSKTKTKNVMSKDTAKTSAAKRASSKAITETSTKKKTSSATKESSTRTKKKTSTVTKGKKVDFAEYYDLPYRYNQTIVKVLAQTPQMLFVYWDISDEDRLHFNAKFGDEFFHKTRPVLLVHNETMNYTFEVEINDFANSWYLHVNDANCKYVIELGRRPNLYQDTIKEDYVYVTSSNKMDAPNDHILFEKFNPTVVYKNVKTGNVSKKDFSHLSKFKNMQKIYGIYDLYKQIYKNELFDEIADGNLQNSSSSSSQFK